MSVEVQSRRVVVEAHFHSEERPQVFIFSGAASNCLQFGGNNGIPLSAKKSHHTKATLYWTGQCYILISGNNPQVISVNEKPVKVPNVVNSGDFVTVNGQSYKISIEADKLTLGNIRQRPDEEGWSSLYEALKRLCRRTGVMTKSGYTR